MGTTSRTLINVRAGGMDDPDATRAATVLCAYLRAEQASTLRRRVWRTVAVVFLAAWMVNVVTSAFTPVDVAFATGLIGVAVVAVLVADVRARSRLGSLLAGADRS